MSGPTRGPWEWNAKTRDVLAQSERGDEIGNARYWRTIASVEPTGAAPRHEAETDANGRLIAAAPDMLHALEEIIQGSVTDADTCTYCGLYPWSHASGCPVDAARKVVEKAKGEAP